MQQTRDSRFRFDQLRLTSRRRMGGFVSPQLVAALCMLGLGAASIDAIDLGAAASIDAQRRHSQAVTLAQGQMQVLRNLPYEEVAPTEGFAPAPWLALPGQRPGDIEIRIDEPGKEAPLLEQRYSVSWKVEGRPGTSDSMRDVDLRVSWRTAGGAAQSVQLSAWRVR